MAAQVKISLDGVGKRFGRNDEAGGREPAFEALNDVNLDIRDGEFVVIVGPSGCGKSSLLDMIGGLSAPTRGTIRIDGKTVDGPASDRGIVFQQFALFPWRTALQNVAFGLEAKGIGRREREAIARRYLALVGLDGFAGRFPHELSGGMRQRVAIARSLAHDPSVLLMDEPFGALDAQTREILQQELVRIWEQERKTVVFITHDLDEAIYLGQRVAVMTSRPGTIKAVVDVPFDQRAATDDLRSSPEFGQLRHRLWTLIKDEVQRAQAL
ncbi:ABC transporter ATP-binding protein [Burkholderia sp. WAC0059]|uniref:ABC transporter ATP-binding protein n=1 Tax=Burkholderia sp. WAC0059 TaxID=2066022 RepID=UPI000C7ED8CE|nr:ABC transporter ATP-binding protein [Burkholderia sp. WAC0059]PLZ04093.1 ABC transporter ATP-binding protein [Burkholderia sp. WAC0059]